MDVNLIVMATILGTEPVQGMVTVDSNCPKNDHKFREGDRPMNWDKPRDGVWLGMGIFLEIKTILGTLYVLGMVIVLGIVAIIWIMIILGIVPVQGMVTRLL